MTLFVADLASGLDVILAGVIVFTAAILFILAIVVAQWLAEQRTRR